MQTKDTYKLIIVIISLLMIDSFSALAESKPVNSFSINFELVNGLILLEATVDHKKGKYILDTGCSFIAVDGIADEQQIELSSTEFTETASETNLAVFELGSIKRQDVSAMTFDMQNIEALVQTDIDGLIGTQAIEDYDIMIDYAEKKVYFLGKESFRPDIDAASYTIMKTSMHTVEDKSYIDVMVQDESYTLLLDSGANISVMDSRLETRLQDAHQPNTLSVMADDYTLQELKMDLIKIEQLGIIYRDLSMVQSTKPIDGILSLTSLGIDKVIFDYSSGQVIFFWAKHDHASAY